MQTDKTQIFPKYLYRYTNIENLKHILIDRTIRFSPLTTMDDYMEQYSALDNEEGKCVFISCWTNQVEENEKMWRDYCRPDISKGVRIKLPVNPFSSDENEYLPNYKDALGFVICWGIRYSAERLNELLGKLPSGFDEHKQMLQRLKIQQPDAYQDIHRVLDEVSFDQVYCLTPDLDNILHKVTYTDDFEKLFPSIYKQYRELIGIDFGKFGQVKDTSWKWQSEWRYLLHFRRLRNGKCHNNGTITTYALPFDHYDLYIDKDALKEAEITLSPTISDEDREVVLQLVKESGYKELISVVESSLHM